MTKLGLTVGICFTLHVHYIYIFALVLVRVKLSLRAVSALEQAEQKKRGRVDA